LKAKRNVIIVVPKYLKFETRQGRTISILFKQRNMRGFRDVIFTIASIRGNIFLQNFTPAHPFFGGGAGTDVLCMDAADKYYLFD